MSDAAASTDPVASSPSLPPSPEIAVFTSTLTSLLSSVSSQHTQTISDLHLRVSVLQTLLDTTISTLKSTVDDAVERRIRDMLSDGELSSGESVKTAVEKVRSETAVQASTFVKESDFSDRVSELISSSHPRPSPPDPSTLHHLAASLHPFLLSSLHEILSTGPDAPLERIAELERRCVADLLVSFEETHDAGIDDVVEASCRGGQQPQQQQPQPQQQQQQQQQQPQPQPTPKSQRASNNLPKLPLAECKLSPSPRQSLASSGRRLLDPILTKGGTPRSARGSSPRTPRERAEEKGKEKEEKEEKEKDGDGAGNADEEGAEKDEDAAEGERTNAETRERSDEIAAAHTSSAAPPVLSSPTVVDVVAVAAPATAATIAAPATAATIVPESSSPRPPVISAASTDATAAVAAAAIVPAPTSSSHVSISPPDASVSARVEDVVPAHLQPSLSSSSSSSSPSPGSSTPPKTVLSTEASRASPTPNKRLTSERAVIDLSSDQRLEYETAFKLFDRSGTGNVTTKELGSVMRSLGQVISEPDLQAMIAEVDVDGSGSVDFNEFAQMMMAKAASVAADDEAKEEEGGDGIRPLKSPKAGRAKAPNFLQAVKRAQATLLMEAKADPSKTRLSSLPALAEIVAQRMTLPKMEKLLNDFMSKTNARLKLLEDMWEVRDRELSLHAIGESFRRRGMKGEVPQHRHNAQSVISSVADRVVRLEELLTKSEMFGDERNAPPPIGRRMAAVELRTAALAGMPQAVVSDSSSLDFATLESSLLMKLADADSRNGDALAALRTSIVDDISPQVEALGGRVAAVQSTLQTVVGGPMLGAESAVADALAHLKAVADCFKSVESIGGKQAGANKETIEDLLQLGAASAAAFKNVESVAPSPEDAAAAVKKGSAAGVSIIRTVGEVGAVLFDYLDRLPGVTRTALAKVPFRLAHDGKANRTVVEGIQLCVDAIRRLLAATSDPGSLALAALTSERRINRKLDIEAAAETYTSVEYTNALHDSLRRQVIAAGDESKHFEEGVRKVLADVEEGASAREAVNALGVSMDEVRSRFIKMQSELGTKVGMEETFELMNKMSDTLRSQLSKTPQLDRLHNLIKRKADKEQILLLDEEIKGLSVNNLPPSLTKAACLTCNRPFGKSVGLAHGSTIHGTSDQATWRPAAVTTEDGREIAVLNTDKPISTVKRLGDVYASTTNVGDLMGGVGGSISDPRKIIASKKNISFGGGVGGAAMLGEGSSPNRGGGNGLPPVASTDGGGVVVSKYPAPGGRMLHKDLSRP